MSSHQSQTTTHSTTLAKRQQEQELSQSQSQSQSQSKSQPHQQDVLQRDDNDYVIEEQEQSAKASASVCLFSSPKHFSSIDHHLYWLVLSFHLGGNQSQHIRSDRRGILIQVKQQQQHQVGNAARPPRRRNRTERAARGIREDERLVFPRSFWCDLIRCWLRCCRSWSS